VYDTNDDQWVYGLYNASQSFLVQKYSTFSTGSGSANGAALHHFGTEEFAGFSHVAIADNSVTSPFVQTNNELLARNPQTSAALTGKVIDTPAADPSLIDALRMELGKLAVHSVPAGGCHAARSGAGPACQLSSKRSHSESTAWRSSALS
jgi:hypothetical protein